MSAYVQIQILAVLVALTASLLGPFLILRQTAMMIDSITHTILLGIVLGFLLTHDLNSPLLIVGAAAVGVLTVYLTELLHHTRLVNKDAAIGIIFPLLFSIAVILISVYADRVHLDIDSVLLGKIEYAPFDALVLGGVNLGAKSIYVMLAILLVNLLYIVAFFKELTLVTFDENLAVSLGFSAVFLHYSLMTLVSVTTVGAFQAVGSILVIAFMVAPAASAYLLTDNIRHMMLLTASLGACSGLVGFWIARFFDVSIAGSMAAVLGLAFLLCWLFSPRYGLFSELRRRRRNQRNFDELNLMFHILNHSGDPWEHRRECHVDTVEQHLKKSSPVMKAMIESLLARDMIYIKENILHLSERGRDYVQKRYEEIFLGM